MRNIHCLCLFLTLASRSLALELSDDAIQRPPSLLSQGVLNTGVETTGTVTDGQFSVMQPIWSNLGESGKLTGTLVFAEPYAAWIERGAVDAGLGFGVRHLFGSQPASDLTGPSSRTPGFLEEGWYVGANLYADMLQTANDVRYWQMTPGVEIGTRYLELRGHYQFPLTEGETTQGADTLISHTSSNTLSGGTRFMTDQVSTLHRSFSVLHESVQGGDIEAAALVPWLDQYMDLKLVGGYASFHSTTLDAIKYDSWKAGAELRPFPACVLSAMWYENVHMVGEHWMYGIRLELPFETADIGDGKGGFWGHIKDAFKSRRRHLAERMVESVHAHQLEPQIASYVSKTTLEAARQFHGAIILPDGQVLTYRSETAFHSQSSKAGTTTTTSQSSASSGDVFNLLDWASGGTSSAYSAASSASYSAGFSISSGSYTNFGPSTYSTPAGTVQTTSGISWQRGDPVQTTPGTNP